jgi:ATP-dependent helicase YprA (DUF1998 family)
MLPGKSLLYLLPILEAILLNPSLTALVIFPTKVLSPSSSPLLLFLLPSSF